jgi:acetyl-CoA carboxylase biotin carboxyl carrier protein
MSITHKELVEILSHLEESSCEEFSLQMDGVDLLLRRKVDGAGALLPSATSRPRRQARPSDERAAPKQDLPTESQTSSPAPQAPSDGVGHVELIAPMNGVFYRRPSPDEPTFVEVGDEVNEGDPLCVIEVMKLFSTLYASCSGLITSINVEDGTSIEKGQVLITIDPSN